MAPSHSYTASPMRHRSPQPSPTHRAPSEESTQYEMDLNALDMNSALGSTGLGTDLEPKLDIVDTSDIEGPEDFTMNMTYWMTTDLPLSQIRSCNETNSKVEEIQGGARFVVDGAQDTTEEGDKAIVEGSSRESEAKHDYDSRSPTMRPNGTTDLYHNGKELSESSMENEEKVMSYLSALPDTDIGDAITSTSLKLAQQNTLQMPNVASSKARSLQATVEDYTDTPRKATQETVIHHIPKPSTQLESPVDNSSGSQIEQLKLRLEQHELASKIRITELETLLSFTRSELDTTRTENYKQKEQITILERESDIWKQKRDIAEESLTARLKEQEQELTTKMQEYGEELRLQNNAKLQNQRGDFERQLRASEEVRKAAEEQIQKRDQRLEQLCSEFDKLLQSKEHELQEIRNTQAEERQRQEQKHISERSGLNAKLSSLQARADTLQADLEKATVEAKSARKETGATTILHALSQTSNQAHTSQIEDLESRVQSLQAQLDSSHADVTSKDQQILHSIEEHERLEQHLNAAQSRIEGIETTISTLRQQLAEAHRETAKAKTDAERFERDIENATDRLQETRAEADRRVADVEMKLNRMKELKIEAETCFRDLQAEHNNLAEDHEAKLEDVREKAEDAVRKVGAMLEQERSEKKRLVKEMMKLNTELEQLRSEAEQRVVAEESSSTDEEDISSSHANSKDAEIENLRTLLRKQDQAMKRLKTEVSTLRKSHKNFTIQENAITSLHLENERLKAEAEARSQDFEAVNKQMDERLAALLRRTLKERARNVVARRDNQWAESLEKIEGEREFMGKVLMREWGKQECGVGEGEKQTYQYKYVQRS